MAYIEFKNVVKEYIVGENKIKALNNANFEIENAGEAQATATGNGKKEKGEEDE